MPRDGRLTRIDLFVSAGADLNHGGKVGLEELVVSWLSVEVRLPPSLPVGINTTGTILVMEEGEREEQPCGQRLARGGSGLSFGDRVQVSTSPRPCGDLTLG